MHLLHIHHPKPITYLQSLKLQENLLKLHFEYKSALRNNSNTSPTSNLPPKPLPTLLTFQAKPTYTVGRRHLTANPLSEAQISLLTGSRSLRASTCASTAGSDSVTTATEEARHKEYNGSLIDKSRNGDGDGDGDHGLATFYPSPRGGLLTYHAPGQLTAYLVIDLRVHGLTPRCYVRMLENTVMRTCARHGVKNTLTTDDPGVWIAEPAGPVEEPQEQINSLSRSHGSFDGVDVDDACGLQSYNSPAEKQGLRATDRKICAIGVHVSRGVTSHGIGLNVFDAAIDALSPPRELYTLPRGDYYAPKQSRGSSAVDGGLVKNGEVLAPGYLSWGFSRIVACGLEGKRVTWLAREQSHERGEVPTLEKVAGTLAEEVAQSLMIEKERIITATPVNYRGRESL